MRGGDKTDLTLNVQSDRNIKALIVQEAYLDILFPRWKAVVILDKYFFAFIKFVRETIRYTFQT